MRLTVSEALVALCVIGLGLSSVLVPQAEPVVSFSSERDGDNEIYLLHLDSNTLQEITDNTWDDFGHGWSPDGSQIAFSSNRDGNYEIYFMDADGDNPQRLTCRNQPCLVTVR